MNCIDNIKTIKKLNKYLQFAAKEIKNTQSLYEIKKRMGLVRDIEKRITIVFRSREIYQPKQLNNSLTSREKQRKLVKKEIKKLISVR